MRRMMDKMGLDMQEMPNVREVLIRTDKKEIILSKPEVRLASLACQDPSCPSCAAYCGYLRASSLRINLSVVLRYLLYAPLDLYSLLQWFYMREPLYRLL